MPLHHFCLAVPQSKLEPFVTFLTSSLQPLGFKQLVRPIPSIVGLGETTPYLWVNVPDIESVDAKMQEAILKKQHIAFSATTTEQVHQFHAAALKSGGICNGPPGIRTKYGPGYYAAFVLDPALGINVEVACQNGESE